MTKVLIDRAVVEQALEALEHVVRQAQENLVPTIQYGPVHDVMNNLRAALAEPTAPSDCPHSHQPVAWMVYTLDGKSVCVTDNPADFTEQHKALPLYTSPAQGEQR